MHIQKTSSWLGDFILLWACPQLLLDFRKERPLGFFYDKMKSKISTLQGCNVRVSTGGGSYGYHYHLPRYMEPYQNRSTVTVFRNPMERLISAYFFNDGMMFPLGEPYRGTQQQMKKTQLRNTSAPIISYAYLEGIPSCQTKMVLGYDCGTPIHFSDREIEEAKRRIEFDLLFFGLSEESEATANLFYAMLGRNIPFEEDATPYMVPCKLGYRVNKHVNSSDKESARNILMRYRWSDKADEALYNHAQNVFYRRCNEYNISTNKYPQPFLSTI
jgi:hypothetical protein